MVETIKHYFWDSCVFIAFLNDESHAYDVNSLRTFLNEAEHGLCKIYTSTIVFAEITPNKLKNSKFGKFDDFLKDMNNTIILLDPNVNIMHRAGLLKDIQYRKNGGKRIITTGDAIMIASYLEAIDGFEIPMDAFHTFDKGKSNSIPEGKGVPLIGYNEWFESVPESILVNRIKNIDICEPIHPEPEMF
ncbi:MAG: hypothetical protein COB24_12900 [Hyphomicrobiales bacterium]|nr:MAG: hypothetical protein COB24_12900 [Hyphomicrobiales bacterium]